jgi:hypothetical protein
VRKYTYKIKFLDTTHARVVKRRRFIPWGKKHVTFVSRDRDLSYEAWDFDPLIPGFPLSDPLQDQLKKEVTDYKWNAVSPWKPLEPPPKVIAKYKVLPEKTP